MCRLNRSKSVAQVSFLEGWSRSWRYVVRWSISREYFFWMNQLPVSILFHVKSYENAPKTQAGRYCYPGFDTLHGWRCSVIASGWWKTAKWWKLAPHKNMINSYYKPLYAVYSDNIFHLLQILEKYPNRINSYAFGDKVHVIVDKSEKELLIILQKKISKIFRLKRLNQRLRIVLLTCRLENSGLILNNIND